MKGIQISSPFKLNHKPIDTRYIVNTIEELNNLNPYIGLATYCLEDNTRYIWRGEWVTEYQIRNELDGIDIYKWEDLTPEIFTTIANSIAVAKKSIIFYIEYNGEIIPASYSLDSPSIVAIVQNKSTLIDYTILSYTDKPTVTEVSLTELLARLTLDENTSVYSIEYTAIETESENQLDSLGFNLYNKNGQVIQSIPIKDLGFELTYGENSGIIQLKSNGTVLTQIDTKAEKILKSAIFDNETEDLVLTFYGADTDPETGDNIISDNIIRIPLDSISDKIRYYTADGNYVVLNSTNTPDLKDSTNEFTLSDRVKANVDAVPGIRSDLNTETNRSITTDARIDKKLDDEITRATNRENSIEENANSRVSKSGDTMTGLLTAHSIDLVNNLKPTIDNNSSIGSAENRLKDIYLAGNITNGTYTLAVDNIAAKDILENTINNLNTETSTSIIIRISIKMTRIYTKYIFSIRGII